MSEEKAIKLPSRTVVLALMKESVATKEKTAEIAGRFGERVKAQVENGGMDAAAFRIAAGIYRLYQNNEIKAKDRVAHLRAYLDMIEDHIAQAGHVGNLDDMAKKPTASQAAAGLTAPDEAPAPDRLTTAEALKRFRQANEQGGTFAADNEATDATDAEPIEKPKAKRGRPPKLKVVGNDEPEAAPEPPAPVVDHLSDDDEWQGAAPTPPEPAVASAAH